MHTPPINHGPPGDDSWQEILLVLRQMSLCLERGEESAVTRLRSSRLEPLVAGYRQIHGAAALPDERLNEALTGERARVNEATLLCSVLAPMLADELQPDSGRRPDQPPMEPAAARIPERGPRPAGIADFIDDMIAQEDAPPPRRNRPSRSPSGKQQVSP